MLPDRVSNPGPLTYESGALPIALHGPAGVIETLGTDVSENHFRTKSVSALHPILPVYFNILSPGLGPYSNFEIQLFDLFRRIHLY